VWKGSILYTLAASALNMLVQGVEAAWLCPRPELCLTAPLALGRAVDQSRKRWREPVETAGSV
jgi:hypothetical protein